VSQERPFNPLTPAELAELKTTYRRELATIKTEIDRAKRAGIDTAALEERWQHYENLRKGIIAEYDSRPPTRARPAR
jgi:hypothetical protein